MMEATELATKCNSGGDTGMNHKKSAEVIVVAN